jgi:hypothetical protein
MANQELESIDYALFHDELRMAMTSYYEGILKMPGVSGVVNKASYERPIKSMTRTDGDIHVQAPPPATDAAAAPAAAATAEDPPADKVASPVKDSEKSAAKGGKGTKTK